MSEYEYLDLMVQMKDSMGLASVNIERRGRGSASNRWEMR